MASRLLVTDFTLALKSSKLSYLQNGRPNGSRKVSTAVAYYGLKTPPYKLVMTLADEMGKKVGEMIENLQKFKESMPQIKRKRTEDQEEIVVKSIYETLLSDLEEMEQEEDQLLCYFRRFMTRMLENVTYHEFGESLDDNLKPHEFNKGVRAKKKPLLNTSIYSPPPPINATPSTHILKQKKMFATSLNLNFLHCGKRSKGESSVQKPGKTFVKRKYLFTRVKAFLRCEEFSEDEGEAIIVDFDGITATRKEFCCLRPHGLINNTVIDLVVKDCTERSRSETPKLRRWYMPMVFQYMSIYSDVSAASSLYRHCRHYMGPIDQCEQIFVPMHDGWNHWFLTVVEVKRKEVHMFDTLPMVGDDDRRRCLVQKMLFMLSEVLSCHKVNGGKYDIGDVSHWDIVVPYKVPRQTNEYDCGMYVIKFMRDMHISSYILTVCKKSCRDELATQLICHKRNKVKSDAKKLVRSVAS